MSPRDDGRPAHRPRATRGAPSSRALALALLATAAGSAGCGSGGATPPAPAPAGLRYPDQGPVPPLPSWPDDPTTDAKVKLGTDLFFDARLSGSGHSSCNACHLYKTGFQDNLLLSVPDRSYPKDRPTLTRNTLSFLNIVYAPVFRWDGSHTDLLQVMPFPFSEPNMNLGADVPSAQVGLKKRLTADVPAYLPLFQAAFGADLRALDPPAVWLLAGRALRAFATKAVSRDAAFDRWNAGDDAAMSPAAVHGYALFRNEGRCIACHGGPLFTDFSFHNVSSALPGKDGKRADEGRFLITGKAEDKGRFLTPTLRSAYVTAPYFHDGQEPTVRTVIRHLASAAVTADPNHDPIFDAPITLSDADIGDLAELLGALRGQPVDGSIDVPFPGTP